MNEKINKSIKEVNIILDISENYLYLLDETIRKIESEIDNLDNKLQTLNTINSEEQILIKNKITYYSNKVKSLIKQESIVEDIVNRCHDFIYWTKPPIKTDGVIDLRKKVRYGHSIKANYEIYLHNEKTQVGNIDYRGYHISKFGDIGYDINKKYQGNNYAYRALCLLSELLKENGVEDFWISSYNENIPSIKTIEKYGGEKIYDKVYRVYKSPTSIIK